MDIRPDADYAELLEGLANAGHCTAHLALTTGLTGTCAGYVLKKAGRLALAAAPDVLVIANEARDLGAVSVDVAEHLATAGDPAGGLLSWDWAIELVKRMVLARATDPAILDQAATWLAPYLAT